MNLELLKIKQKYYKLTTQAEVNERIAELNALATKAGRTNNKNVKNVRGGLKVNNATKRAANARAEQRFGVVGKMARGVASGVQAVGGAAKRGAQAIGQVRPPFRYKKVNK